MNTDEMGSFLSFLCFQLLPSYSSLESRLLLQDEVFLCEMTYFTWFYLCIWLSGTGPGGGGGGGGPGLPNHRNAGRDIFETS